MYNAPELILALGLPTLAVVAGLKDLTSYTIPNWISLVLLALFVPSAVLSDMPLEAVLWMVGFGVLALLAGMGMFAAGWIGGGDAKFFAMAALWLGPATAVTYLAVTALCGGALAVGLLGLRSIWLRPVAVQGPTWLSRLATPDAAVPYGVAIAIGALVAYPHSALFLALIS